MTEYCPRGQGPTFKPPFSGEMTWDQEDNTCSYCGSLNPDTFMERLRKGDVEVIPTDKNYKAYLRNLEGAPFLQHYRSCPQDAKCTGPDDCTHWVTREQDQTKFYFQHLNEEQQTEFIKIFNEKKMKLAMPGHFYRTPFFCTPA